MLKTDFSKVEELFYKDVGEDDRLVSLDGFIRHSLGNFVRFTQGNPSGRKQTDYLSINRDCRVSFQLFSQAREPDIASIEITGITKDFNALFGKLDGFLEAYLDVDIEKMDPSAKSVVKNARRGNMACMYDVTFFFSSHPEKKDRIESAVVQQCTNPLRREYSQLAVKQARIGPVSKALLSLADRISVQNSFYQDNDARNNVNNEFCEIGQKVLGEYNWQYGISSPVNCGLPFEAFTRAKEFFELVKDKFGTQSFNNVSFFDPKNEPAGVDYGQ